MKRKKLKGKLVMRNMQKFCQATDKVCHGVDREMTKSCGQFGHLPQSVDLKIWHQFCFLKRERR